MIAFILYSLNTVSSWFNMARLYQTHFPCHFFPANEPVKARNHVPHNNNKIALCKAQLKWTFSIILHCG